MLLVLLSLALLTVYFRESGNGRLHGVQSTGAVVLRPFEVAANRVAQPFRDLSGWISGLTHARFTVDLVEATLARTGEGRGRRSPAAGRCRAAR